MAEIHQSFVHVAVASGHGLVVFWWHCSTLRTSHFVYDILWMMSFFVFWSQWWHVTSVCYTTV